MYNNKEYRPVVSGFKIILCTPKTTDHEVQPPLGESLSEWFLLVCGWGRGQTARERGVSTRYMYDMGRRAERLNLIRVVDGDQHALPVYAIQKNWTRWDAPDGGGMYPRHRRSQVHTPLNPQVHTPSEPPGPDSDVKERSKEKKKESAREADREAAANDRRLKILRTAAATLMLATITTSTPWPPHCVHRRSRPGGQR